MYIYTFFIDIYTYIYIIIFHLFLSCLRGMVSNAKTQKMPKLSTMNIFASEIIIGANH